ncbi:hypothetical protein [Salipiger sp. PrR002]|uniref:hypothetical protein n=1 Tax=Salipiger sp. PrR002 TaxID=2706489 RepID=UPI0013BA6868|nr:hypothetical protein [Salipiger sp. PrR002]NDW02713.1 hypothetical protein [Salipiger sp. PrR002]NDW60007.1 hypothetical protein [Salipiger sp. PrR004]
MALLTLSHSSVVDRLLRLSWLRAGPDARSDVADLSADETRARRDFVNEMMQRCPEAFSSDLDVQSMMFYISRRF